MNRKKMMAVSLTVAMTAGMLTGAASVSAADKTYTVGICQLVQHPALDAATKGFEDELKAELGDAVTFDEQNAAGDTATATTICQNLVSENVDLIERGGGDDGNPDPRHVDHGLCDRAGSGRFQRYSRRQYLRYI